MSIKNRRGLSLFFLTFFLLISFLTLSMSQVKADDEIVIKKIGIFDEGTNILVNKDDWDKLPGIKRSVYDSVNSGFRLENSKINSDNAEEYASTLTNTYKVIRYIDASWNLSDKNISIAEIKYDSSKNKTIDGINSFAYTIYIEDNQKLEDSYSFKWAESQGNFQGEPVKELTLYVIPKEIEKEAYKIGFISIPFTDEYKDGFDEIFQIQKSTWNTENGPFEYQAYREDFNDNPENFEGYLNSHFSNLTYITDSEWNVYNIGNINFKYKDDENSENNVYLYDIYTGEDPLNKIYKFKWKWENGAQISGDSADFTLKVTVNNNYYKVEDSLTNGLSDSEQILNINGNIPINKSTLLAGDYFNSNYNKLSYENTSSILNGQNLENTITNFRNHYILGEASNFSVFLEKDFTVRNSDSEGRVAVGGILKNLAGWNYDIGSGDYNTHTPLNKLLGTQNTATIIAGDYKSGDYNGSLSNRYYCYETNDIHKESQNLHTPNQSEKIVVLNSNSSEENQDKIKSVIESINNKNILFNARNQEQISTDQIYFTQLIDFSKSFDYLKQLSNNLSNHEPDNFSFNENSNGEVIVTYSEDNKDQGRDCLYLTFDLSNPNDLQNYNLFTEAKVIRFRDIPSLDSGRDVVNNYGTIGKWNYKYIVITIKSCDEETTYYTSGQGKDYYNKKTYINNICIGKGDGTEDWAENNDVGVTSLLFNYPDVKKLVLGGNFQGTILAPNADVTDQQLENIATDHGHLSGALIAKSFDGYTEFGYRPFSATISEFNPGNLEIIKRINGIDNVSKYIDKTFEFTIYGPEDCLSNNCSISYINSDGTNQVLTFNSTDETIDNISYKSKATINIKANIPLQIYNLPQGNYKVVETKESLDIDEYKWTSSEDNNDGNISIIDNSRASITVTNNYENNSISIPISVSKRIIGDTPAEPSQFEFTLSQVSSTQEITQELQRIQINGEGTESFKPLIFSTAGTYNYVINEVKGSVPGYSYDDTSYKISIQVKEINNQLEIESVKLNDEDKINFESINVLFTNNLDLSKINSVTTGFNIVKKVEGIGAPNIEGSSYSFSIKPDSNNPSSDPIREELIKSTLGSNFTNELSPTVEKISIENLTYTEAGQYIYYISEDIPTDQVAGISYDVRQHTLIVNVVRNDLNQLVATATLDGNPFNLIDTENPETSGNIEFVNYYNPSSITVPIIGDKIYNNGTLDKEGPFRFILEAVGNNSKEVLDSELITVQNEYNHFIFNNLVFTKAGIYEFEVSEDKNVGPTLNEGESINYDDTVYKVTVNITDDHGALKATVTYKVGSESRDGIVFENTLNLPNPEPTEIGFNIKKTVEGDKSPAIGEGEYSFRIEADLSNLELDPLKHTNKEVFTSGISEGNSEIISVDNIRYTEAGQYIYYISEIIPEDQVAGISYDVRQHTLIVNVVRNDLNQLVATATLDGNPFNLIDTENPETSGNIEFVNYYNPSSITVPIIGDKIYNNGTLDKEGPFRFILEALDNNSKEVLGGQESVQVSNKDSYLIFNNLVFTKAGIYEFEVREDKNAEPILKEGESIDYDNTVYKVTVNVTDEDAVLKAEVTYTVESKSVDGIVFENTLNLPNPEPTEIGFNIKKTVEGDKSPAIGEGEYSFRIEADLSNLESDPLKHTNKEVFTSGISEGNSEIISVGNIRYTEAGQYIYYISEIIPEDQVAGISYDVRRHTLIVNVVRNDLNQLVATATLDGNPFNLIDTENPETSGNIEFVNSYNPQLLTIPIRGTKIYNNGILLENGPFVFELSAVDSEGNDLAKALLPQPIITTNNYSNFTFDKLSFTQEGSYIFEVKEIYKDNESIDYDNTIYTVIIEIKNVLGVLKSHLTYEVNDIEQNNLVFVNTNKDKLDEDDKPIDISKTIGGLTISKLVANGLPEDNSKEFTFTIYLTSDKLNESNNEFDYRIITDEDDEITDFSEKIKFTSVNNSENLWVSDPIKLIHGQIIDIRNLPANAEYEVEETIDPTFNPVSTKERGKIPGGYSAHVSYTNYKVNNTIDIESPEKPNIEIEKEQQLNSGNRVKNLQEVKENDLVTYYITVKNTGNEVAKDITITDKVEDGLEVIQNSISAGGNLNNRTITWIIPELQPKATFTVSFTVRIPLVNSSKIWTNGAKVIYNNNPAGPDKGIDSNTVQIKETVDGVPSLSIEKLQAQGYGTGTKSSLDVNSSDLVTYYLRVRNISKVAAENVVITDQVPAGLTLITVNDNGVNTDGILTWAVGNIPAGETRTVSFTVQVPKVENTTSWTNIAFTRFSNNPDGPNDSITSNEVVIREEVANQEEDNKPTEIPELTIHKEQSLYGFSYTDEYVQYSEEDNIITYQITVENISDVVASNIIISDIVPEGTTYVGDYSETGIEAVQNNNVLTWTIPEIAAHESVSVTFTVMIDEGISTVQNTARLKYGDITADSNTVLAGTDEQPQDSTEAPEWPSDTENPDNPGNSANTPSDEYQDSTESPSGSNPGNNSNNIVDSTLSPNNVNSTNTTTADDINRANNTSSTTSTVKSTSVTKASPKTGVVATTSLWIALVGLAGTGLVINQKKNKK